MQLLDQYLEIQKQIHDYFGYVEDWVVIPLDDAREYFWQCNGDIVRFANTLEELKSQTGNCYENIIYRQRFLPKWIYEADDFTMICVDTQTDGNKFLMVFDNAKRYK